MKTREEQEAFLQEQWPALADALARDGQAGVARVLASFGDPLQRRVLAFMSRQCLLQEPVTVRGADRITALARAGIAELLAQAEAAEDDETRARFTDLANAMSYNLAADLADCWPGEERLSPDEEAFRAGLEAADACIRWREELGKGPGPLSGAWWAKGMHQLSLGDRAGAVESWRTSLRFAEEAAEGDDEAFGVLLGRGYLGLALWHLDEPPGQSAFESALAAFARQLEDEQKKDDAAFGIEQLRTVRDRYPPAS